MRLRTIAIVCVAIRCGRSPSTPASQGLRAHAAAPTKKKAAAPAAAPSTPELEQAMLRANKAYDQQDFETARTEAERVLAFDPTNVRMLRLVVSSACILGEPEEARAHYPKLPTPDQAQMRTRCERYGVSLTTP